METGRYFRKFGLFILGVVLSLALIESANTEYYVKIVTPADGGIADTTPVLDVTMSIPSNLYYRWSPGFDLEKTILGCRNCTSYRTTYGEYAPTGWAEAPDASLVGLWHANENSDTTLYDNSLYSNNGEWKKNYWGYSDNNSISIADLEASSSSSPFTDLCYGNGRFLYVYSKYGAVPYIQVMALFLKRDDVDNRIVATDGNIYDVASDRYPAEILANPSCHYVDNGNNSGGAFYIGFSHSWGGGSSKQHVMLYKLEVDNTGTPITGWSFFYSTFSDQERENPLAGGNDFLAIELFGLNVNGNNHLMGIGVFGKERPSNGVGAPATTNLRVFDFTDKIFYSYYTDGAYYISSPRMIKVGDVYYITYYQATGDNPDTFEIEPFIADIMLVSTTDFITFSNSVCVSGDCGNPYKDPNTEVIENKWPTIALLDGKLFVGYASRKDKQGRLDYSYATSSDYVTTTNILGEVTLSATFSDYGAIGNGVGDENYASMFVDSLGPVLIAQRAVSGWSRHYLMTDMFPFPWTEDGKFGPALSFNGIDDYLDVGNNTNLNIAENITVSAWINTSEAVPDDWDRIVGKGKIRYDANGSLAGLTSFVLYRLSGEQKVGFGISTDPDPVSFKYVISTTNVTPGEWMHIAGVYDGFSIYIYINGNLEATAPVSGNILSTTEPVVIGANTSASPRKQFFNGKIDEVMIFDRALNATEIGDIHNKSFSVGSHSVTVWAWNDLPQVGEFANFTVIPGVSVRDFIPVGVDPATQDSTTYIQAALDTGEDIYFPPGSYRTTTPLRLKTNGQTIFGEGQIITTGNRCLLTDIPLYDVTIKGLTLQNLGEAEGGTDSALGIYSEPNGFAGFVRSDFIGLTLVGFGIGFSLSGVPDAPVLGLGDNNRITDSIIRDTLAGIRIGTGGGSGIYIRGGYFHVTNNLIENMQGGILWSTAYGVIANSRIINAWDDNGIYVAGSGSVSVTGNYIENTKADGIAMSTAQDITVAENTIINAGNGCIRVQAGLRITISGNTCRAGGRSNHFIRGYASADYPGSSDVTIANNIFQGPTSLSSNPIIFVSGSSPHSGIIIMDNTFYDLDTSPLSGDFFGPYAITNIKNSIDEIPPVDCSVSGNFFNDIQSISGYDESVFIRGATSTSNTFTYK